MTNVPLGFPLATMRSPDVREALARGNTILVPFGATEQHGPALPVGADTIIAEAIAAAASQRTGLPYAPVLPYGLSAFHMSFPGTISLSVQAYGTLVGDVLRALKHHGFSRQVLINAHFENSGVLRAIAEEVASQSSDLVIAICDFWDMPNARLVASSHFREVGGHADAADAALLLHLLGHAVAPDSFTEEWPALSAIVSPDLASTLITQSGVIGSNQHSATRQAGEAYFLAIVEDVSERALELARIPRP